MLKLLLAGSLLALAPYAMQSGPTVTLVENGQPRGAILLPADATPAMRHGAEELQRFIGQMSGGQLPITTDESAGPVVIRIESDPGMGDEELRVATDGDQVVISGGGERGAMYGCYALLEDVLGCRFYTKLSSKVPKERTIVVGPLDLREKPAFEYREPYYWEAFDRDWAARNRTNGNFAHLDDSVGGHVVYGKFVHTFNELVPPDVYFDKHPEYFSMINGKRMKGYYQLCLTNPDVVKIAIARVKEWIQENPTATIFSVSQNDNESYCQCPECQAVAKEEGAQSGPLLRFVNEVANGIAKEYPHVLIDTLAYQWSEDPPLHVRPAPNVRIRLAPIGACVAHGFDQCSENAHVLANLNAWSSITHQLYIWHYSTNFANYLQPLPDLDEIARDIPLFHKKGVVGIFYEGDYDRGGCGGLAELQAYLQAQLLWNPAQPAQPIIDDFVNNVYGAGAPFMRKWVDLLEAPARAGVHAHIYDPPTAPYLPDSTLAEGNDLFDAAEAATMHQSTAHEEVQRARLALQYVQLMRLLPTEQQAAAQTQSQAEPWEALAKQVTGKIHRYQIARVREGQPVKDFEDRLAKLEKLVGTQAQTHA